MNGVKKWVWERDDTYWETGFVDYLERIGRKTLFYNDFKGVNDKRRLFIKGLFVCFILFFVYFVFVFVFVLFLFCFFVFVFLFFLIPFLPRSLPP